MAIDKHAVVDKKTGAVIRFGYTDFANDHDSIVQSVVKLKDNTKPVKDIPHYHQKIVNGSFVEMEDEEKIEVDNERIPPAPKPKRFPASDIDPSQVSVNEGDRYYNNLLCMDMQYDAVRMKWLSVNGQSIHAACDGMTSSGAYYRRVDGLEMSDKCGVVARYNGTVVAISYTRDNRGDAVFEFVAKGKPIAELESSDDVGFSNEINGDFNQGEILAIRNKNGSMDTQRASIDIEIRWRA